MPGPEVPEVREPGSDLPGRGGVEGRRTSESTAMLFMMILRRTGVEAMEGRNIREGFSEEVAPELGLAGSRRDDVPGTGHCISQGREA